MKKLVNIEEQMAMPLPNRDLMLVTVVITNLLNNNTVSIEVRNVDIAAQICANVIATGNFACQVVQ